MEEVRIALAPELHSRLAAEHATIKAQAKEERAKRRAAVETAKEAVSAGSAKPQAFSSEAQVKSETRDRHTRVAEQLRSLQAAAKSKRDIAIVQLRSRDDTSEVRDHLSNTPSYQTVVTGIQVQEQQMDIDKHDGSEAEEHDTHPLEKSADDAVEDQPNEGSLLHGEANEAASMIVDEEHIESALLMAEEPSLSRVDLEPPMDELHEQITPPTPNESQVASYVQTDTDMGLDIRDSPGNFETDDRQYVDLDIDAFLHEGSQAQEGGDEVLDEDISSTARTCSPVKRSRSKMSTILSDYLDAEAAESPTRHARANTLNKSIKRGFDTPTKATLSMRRRKSEPRLQLTVSQFFSPQ